jgi:hypothetical protein
MARATLNSTAAPWGQLYGCLCSRRELIEEAVTPSHVADQLHQDEYRPIWTRMIEAALAALRRASVTKDH